MIENRVYLYRNNNEIGELVNLSEISWGYVRNGFKPCQFTYIAKNLATQIKDNLIEGSWIKIFRKNTDSRIGTTARLVYKGEIQEITKSIDQEGRKIYTVFVEASGNVYLKNRDITKTYTAEEEEDIAWDIINMVQTDTFSGAYTLSQVDFGITQGTLEITENTRDRQYLDDEVLKILQQLADVLDISPNPQRLRGFRLSPDLIDDSEDVFSWYANYGTDRSDYVKLVSSVIMNISETTSIKMLANRVTGNGKDGIQQTATTTDTDHLDFYKMRKMFISKTNIETNSELLEQTKEHLETVLIPSVVYSFSLRANNMFTGDYRCGDLVRLEYDDNFITVSTNVRVYEIDMLYNQDGVETVTLKVAEEKPINLNVRPEDKLVGAIKNLQDRMTETEK